MINPIKVYRQDVTVVNFYGQEIVTVMLEELGTPAVFARPLIENLGLAWQPQHAKLMESPRFQAVVVNVKALDDDQVREHVVIPLRTLNAFLFSINPSKVPEDKFMQIDGEDISVRDNLIKYQSECTVALHDYWMHGMAINTRVNPSDIRTERKLGPVTYSRGRIERVLPKFMDYAASIGQPLERGILMQGLCVAIAEYVGAIAYNPENMTVVRLEPLGAQGMQRVESKLSGRDQWLVAIIENVFCNAMTEAMHQQADVTQFLTTLDVMILDTVTNLGHHFVTCSSTINKGNGDLSAMG